MFSFEVNEKEAKRYRVSPQDIAELERRAGLVLSVGTIQEQGGAVYDLQLDFMRAAVFGDDYPRWLARHSGRALGTCYLRMRLGLALAVTNNPEQTQAELLAELAQREQTAVEVPGWEEEVRPAPRRRKKVRPRSKKKPSRETVAALESRARNWAKVGLRTRLHAETQWAALCNLRAVFQEAGGLGRSFPRWLSRVTGLPLTSVRRYIRNRQQMPGPEMEWD